MYKKYLLDCISNNLLLANTITFFSCYSYCFEAKEFQFCLCNHLIYNEVVRNMLFVIITFYNREKMYLKPLV